MKMSGQVLFIILALSAGIMIPFQSAMNSQLGKSLQSPYYSTLIVFVIAAIGLLLYTLISQQTLPEIKNFSAIPAWSYLGGILGGTYVLLIVICAPRLGIGNVTVMVLLGQILAAIVIDQFGLLNTPVHPINWLRMAGVFFMIAGVYLVKKF